MPSAALASPYTIPFTYEKSIANTPRDDSFSSYLAVVRANITPEFPITPSPLRSTPLLLNLTRKRSDDNTEIDVFAAEKYFNPDTNSPVDKTTKPSPSSSTPSNSHSLTWTVPQSSSGDSSQTPVTSRNTLFRDSRRRTAAGCGGGRLFFLGGFGFWCSSCSRKHAANVNRAQESRTINANFVGQKQSISRSPASWRIETSVPAMWLSPQRLPKLPPAPPPKAFVEKEEDDRSESSSDLFEIESVTMSRAGYEPSEASIAWSVVTASAANVSVASERSWEIGKGRRKSNALLLAGCSSHKAVEVSTTAAAVEVAEGSILPVVARYHVDLEAGGGSGRIVAGRAKGTSWHGGSGRILL